jgi:hypothetical protein
MQNANEVPFIISSKKRAARKKLHSDTAPDSSPWAREAPCKLLNSQWRNNTAKIGLWFGSNDANSIEVDSVGKCIGNVDTSLTSST